MQSIAIGIMAYNEERNIAHLLDSILAQSAGDRITNITVVASGCTDRTGEIVSEYCLRDPRIHLVEEAERGGKVRAINAFFTVVAEPIVLVSSADLIYGTRTVEELVAPLEDARIGMVGAHPVPMNSKNTFVGFTVNLMWQLHHEVALIEPKMGELVAFRQVFKGLNPLTLADEVQIEHGIRSVGYEVAYAPNAIVYNRGPETIREFIAQRTRWYVLNLQIRRRHNIPVSTMQLSTVWRGARSYIKRERPRIDWVLGAVLLEVFCRMKGAFVYRFGSVARTPLWRQQTTTKVLLTGGPRST